MNENVLKHIASRPSTLSIMLPKNYNYPHFYKVLEQQRKNVLTEGFGWPNYCYLPIGGLEVLGQTKRKFYKADALTILLTTGIWRKTKGVYIFDETILEELWRTPITGNLPVEILHYIPEWCVYIATPNQTFGTYRLHGFFARIGRGAEDNEELVLLLDLESPELPYTLRVVAIQLDGTIENGLKKSKKIFDMPDQKEILKDQLWSFNSQQIKPLLSLLLYLCAENAEIRDCQGSNKLPQNLKNKERKPSLHTFSASNICTWEVGYRIGPSLKKARQQNITNSINNDSLEQRSTIIPHIRRAHWHSFWSGSHKDQTRELKLKWLPPIPVNTDKGDVVTTTRQI